MTLVFIIILLLVLVVLIILLRRLYQNSIRIRNRLLLERAFTNISHELLTPLTVISASVERLRLQEPKYSDDYMLMDLNIERMVRLLQEILETSKSQTGELKLKVARGDVMQYINRTALCIEPLMSRRQLAFTIDCTPKSMMGWIDTDKLDKIIYNLLSNAAKYTQPQGSVSLQVRTNNTYDHVTIVVKDTGIGLSKEQQKHLFQRFFDGNYREMHTFGTGLGLALTRDLVELHGGNITCESEEGKGTTFVVTIPINKEAFDKTQIDEQHQIDFDTPHSAILDIAKGLSGKLGLSTPLPDGDTASDTDDTADDAYHILLVEDNMELLMVMQTLLSQKYKIYIAKNGREALEQIKKLELDLVISDVMMPEMDGNQLTQRIKNTPETSHLPIILLTAKTQDEERKQSLLLGADDYIKKPFKLSELELRINNIIENRKRIRQEYKELTVKETIQRTMNKQATPDDLFLRKAVDCVYEHLADSDFDREAFAAAMGASESTLYNKLRSITGLNVTAFIRDIRMKEAKRMAEEDTTQRISDLAYKVGFKDPKYFSTCFKKEFGMQPTEFMEQVNQSL